MLLNSANNLDPTKLSMLNNLLNNQQSSRSALNYAGANQMRSSLNSPQLNVGGAPQLDMLGVVDQTKDPNASYFPKEIEEEVEKCIQGLFKSNSNAPQLSVDDFVTLLSKLKDSPDKKDKDFYNYALKYIVDANSCLYALDEMQFHTMANIWSALIDRNILSTQLLSQVLKLLLQMMSKQNTTRYYFFAFRVLDKCKHR
jgi:hypothetical protein